MPLALRQPDPATGAECPPDGCLPAFDARGLLPTGIHVVAWSEVAARFGWNEHRAYLMGELHIIAHDLRILADTLYLEGDFVTNVERPRDYGAVWDVRADHYRDEYARRARGNRTHTPRGVVAIRLATVPPPE